jgi:hypothetical protein
VQSLCYRSVSLLALLVFIVGGGCALNDDPTLSFPEVRLNETAIVWSLPAPGSTAAESLARESDYDLWTSAKLCEPTINSAFDASFWGLPGSSSGALVVARIVDDNPLESLEVFRADLASQYTAGDDVVLEAMSRVEIPNEIADPVSLSVGFSPSLPTVPNGSGSEHAVAVLMSSGVIRMFAPVDSSKGESSRAWPTQYVYTGAIQPPPLPSGVSVRHFCDIEILPDGDLVVTIAQDPLYADYLREGWIRYNHTTSTWETPVTSYFTYNFLHTAKGGVFERGNCMTVDINYAETYEIFFASNQAVTSSGGSCAKCIWNFDLNTSGIFALNWLRPVPMAEGYGNLQGVAILAPNRIIVQHDYELIEGMEEDRLRVFDTTTNPLQEEDWTHQTNTELYGVAALKAGATASCDFWLAFSTRVGAQSSEPADECATLLAVEVSACD